MSSHWSKISLAVVAGLLLVAGSRAVSAQAITRQTTDDATANTLSDEEQKAGWKLLFDGKTLTGWHTFKRTDVRPGWVVKDGTLA